MRKKRTIYKPVFCLLLSVILLYGCGNIEPIACPYTDLDWNTTEEKLFEAKGDYVNSYNSVYGGLTYEYEGSYMEKNGIVKYMFNEDGELASVAFTYSSTDADELRSLYDQLYEELEAEYGKNEYHAEEPTNYGDTWEMKEGKVLLSVMNTDSLKALQVAYVNPIEMEE